jgi:hypothetical protein
VLGEVALRIDQIGSTAVPGLGAKPIIDIQVSVADFEPLAAFRRPLEQLGYVYRADNPERTKRYFREPPGRRRIHVHVRQAGSFSEQWALLFRDYLRAHPDGSGGGAAGGAGGDPARVAEEDRRQRSSAAALSASRSLSLITVVPELTGRGAVSPQVALRSNSRKKS